MRLSLHAAAALALSLLPRESAAQRARVSAALAGDISLAPSPRGFGIFVVDLRVPRVARGDFHAMLNTDTLQVGLENIALTERLQFNVAARGQALFGGMLPTYIERGEVIPTRGFNASYAQLITSLKWLPGGHLAAELVASARLWIFTAIDGAGPTPDNAISLDPRLRFVYWDLALPNGDTDPTIFHPRFTGLAWGVEVGGEFRPGGASASRSVPLPPRAEISRRVFLARQWLRAGIQGHPRIRVQIEQSASYGENEDDLTRVRVGGMNPYAVQIPGLPWPALLSEIHLAAMLSIHGQVSPRASHEIGVALAGGAFNDPGRRGDLYDFGFFGGAALFGDLRFGAWTLHARVGCAFPSPWLDRGPHVGSFVSLSRRWD